MRILYLAHRIPYPPDKGDKIRSFHEIKQLSLKHEIHLLAFCDNPEDLRFRNDLNSYCRSVTLIPIKPAIQKMKAAASILKREPWSLGYFASNRMSAAVQATLAANKFDLIFVYSSSMAPYVESMDRIPKILDLVDSDGAKWAQYANRMKPPTKWLYAYEAKQLKQYEGRVLNLFDCCTFVSRRETEHLPKGIDGKVQYIQNGIDLEYYKPLPIDPASRNIVFTGAMDYFPNVDAVTFFAAEILPVIRQAVPDARFMIVGSRPDARVRKLSNLPGVTVTGTVTDVRQYLASARVSVTPLRISQGIQNKVLEALAVGLPVVASPAAAAALSPLKNAPLAIAQNPTAYVELVVNALQQPPQTSEQVQSCRRELQEHYDWGRNMSAFETAIETLVRGAVKLHSGLMTASVLSQSLL